MKDYILVSQVRNLKLTGAASFKIKTEKGDFILYSEDILAKLDNFNKAILKIQAQDYPKKYTHNLEFNEIKKEHGAKTFIICSININPSLDFFQLKENIERHHFVLLKLLSLFLRDILSISQVYIFKKTHTFYFFKRMLSFNLGDNYPSNTPQLIQTIGSDLIEDVFPWLYTRMCYKFDFLPFLDEYFNRTS